LVAADSNKTKNKAWTTTFVEELKSFSLEGYAYSAQQSKLSSTAAAPTRLVFTRSGGRPKEEGKKKGHVVKEEKKEGVKGVKGVKKEEPRPSQPPQPPQRGGQKKRAQPGKKPNQEASEEAESEGNQNRSSSLSKRTRSSRYFN
jgi:hypothetical protein